MSFYTAYNERLRITSDGKMCLGTSIHASPSAAFHIDYDSNNLLMLDNSTAATQKIFFAQNASTHAQIYATSNVGSLTIESDPSDNHSSSFIDFRVDGAEHFRIESGGAVKMSTNNAKIRMGSGHPFELYHNGTYSYISDNRSGGSDELRIAGRAVRILNQDSSSTTGYFSYTAAKLYYTNSEKLSTTSDGIQVTGKVFAKATQEPQIELQDSDSSHTGAGAETGIRFRDGAGTLQSDIGHYDSGSSNFKINTAINADIQFSTNNTNRVAIGANGIQPALNNSYDLGSSSYRWRDIYANDLQLSNKGKTNDVDGTWGDYTIQEGESNLFLINNRNGKKYMFNLTEVS